MSNNQYSLKIGARLKQNTYRIEKILGQGTFGITYLATTKMTVMGELGSMQVEAKVAIKEFFMSDFNTRKADGSTVDGSTGDMFVNYRKKFRREAENLAKLSHSNIVKVFEVFDDNDTTYYAMEYIDGCDLDEYISQRGCLPESEATDVLKQIGSAVSYMHSNKMLHLDIKPKNIMRKADGSYYLIDFGLSKQFNAEGNPDTSTKIGLGTPGYAPLEQASFKKDGTFPATIDVYALGATLFKMLTGKRPEDASVILNEGFADDELKSHGVSSNIIRAIERAMAPQQKQRFQTVSDFISNLKNSEEKTELTTGQTSTPKPKSQEQSPKVCKSESTIKKEKRSLRSKICFGISGFGVLLIILVYTMYSTPYLQDVLSADEYEAYQKVVNSPEYPAVGEYFDGKLCHPDTLCVDEHPTWHTYVYDPSEGGDDKYRNLVFYKYSNKKEHKTFYVNLEGNDYWNAGYYTSAHGENQWYSDNIYLRFNKVNRKPKFQDFFMCRMKYAEDRVSFIFIIGIISFISFMIGAGAITMSHDEISGS